MRCAAWLLLLVALCAPRRAEAHNLILVDGRLVAENGLLILTVTTSTADLLSALGHQGMTATRRAHLDPLMPELCEWFAAHLLMELGDAAPAKPNFVKLLSDLQRPGDGAVPIRERLVFVVSWRAEPLPARFTLGSRLYEDAKHPCLFAVRFHPPGSESAQERILGVGGLARFTSQGAGTPASGGAAAVPAASVPADGDGAMGFGDWVAEGFRHIVGFDGGWMPMGLDHILFVLGLYLLARRPRPLLLQITAFTIAHSLTLALAMLDVLRLDARVVESLIAASIAWVAIENIVLREPRSWRWVVVFVFGLLHGLGFASVLRELSWQQGGFLTALLGFNVGVECGQLAVVAAAAALTAWAWRRDWYRARIVVPCSALIAAVGLFWAVQRAFGWD